VGPDLCGLRLRRRCVRMPDSSATARNRESSCMETVARETILALVDRVQEACADPRYAWRKVMWTRHQHLEKVQKVPIHVHLPASGGYSRVWQEIIPAGELVNRDGIARNVELQLRQKLFKHDHVPDDDVILPVLTVPAVYRTPVEDMWGVRLEREEAQFGYAAGGAYKPVPVVRSEVDLEGLDFSGVDVDFEATRSLVEQAQELVDGRLPVVVNGDRVGTSPFEVVVRLRGMDNLLFDVVERPRLVHSLMSFVTENTVQYLRELDRLRLFNTPASWMGCRVHYEEVGADVLSSGSGIETAWSYVSAQSAASISPGMFAEFLQPYHDRLAALYSPGRVYFHGCEDLTAKFRVIKNMPNLRRFHVSPWSNFEVLGPEIGTDFVIEKHVHPTNNLLIFDEAQMRAELEQAMEIGRDLIMDINLSDIHTVGHDPERVARWARVAQEVTERYAR